MEKGKYEQEPWNHKVGMEYIQQCMCSTAGGRTCWGDREGPWRGNFDWLGRRSRPKFSLGDADQSLGLVRDDGGAMGRAKAVVVFGDAAWCHPRSISRNLDKESFSPAPISPPCQESRVEAWNWKHALINKTDQDSQSINQPQTTVFTCLHSAELVDWMIGCLFWSILGIRTSVAPGPLGPRGLGPPLNLDLTKKGNTPPLTKFFGPSWVKEGTLDFFSTVPPSLANLQAPLSHMLSFSRIHSWFLAWWWNWSSRKRFSFEL